MNARRIHDYQSFWYENSKPTLLNQIEWCYQHKFGPNHYNFDEFELSNPIGIVSPHAGYSCSGMYSAIAFEALKRKSEKFDTAIIVGPNHTGIGPMISIFPPNGSWETPLGDVQIDSGLTSEIYSEIANVSNFKVKVDNTAHLNEHSIDNQIPFLQYINKDCKIVAICLMDQRFETCVKLGEILKRVLKNSSSKKIVLIASSDFTHYEPHDKASAQDLNLIEKLENVDLTNAYSIKIKENVSACGFGPIITLFSTAKEMGKKRGVKLIYGSSGLTCSTKASVVGYGALIV